MSMPVVQVVAVKVTVNNARFLLHGVENSAFLASLLEYWTGIPHLPDFKY